MGVQFDVDRPALVFAAIGKYTKPAQVYAGFVALPPPAAFLPFAPRNEEDVLNDGRDSRLAREKSAGKPVDVRGGDVTFAPYYWTGLAFALAGAAACACRWRDIA